MNDPGARAEDGWQRFYVKSSGALQRDLTVYSNESMEEAVFTVAGDKQGAEIQDAGSTVVMRADVKKLIPAKIEYTDSAGTLAGKLKTNSVLSKKRLVLTLPDGTEWAVVRSGALKQNYTVLEGDAAIITLDATDLALKKKYPLEIADGVDLPLAIGLVWAINFNHLGRIAAVGGAAAG